MTCDCIDTVNKLLQTRNTRLSQALMFGSSPNPGLMMETEQVEKGRGKQKAVAMFPTFCPFCGTKYEAEEVVA